MRRISEHVYAEIYFWGCNPGFITTGDGVFMIDTPQQPIDAVRWRERLMEHGTPAHLVNTEPHGDHISGNAYFPGVEVIGQAGMEARYAEAVPRMFSTERAETMAQTDPDSVWLLNHTMYPPNPPTRFFTDELTIDIGGLAVRCLHTPGHTVPQTAVVLAEDGVVFTGDNVFSRCKTFIQEADPWEWLDALQTIGALDIETIVPGHGEPCGKDYLAEQASILEAWIGAVADFVQRGMTEEEALAQPAPDVDPYPIGQRLFAATERVNRSNVSNLYRRITARNESRATS